MPELESPVDIRQSAIKEVKVCRRKWFWQYEKNLVPRSLSTESSGRTPGTLAHAGLAAYYRRTGMDWREAIEDEMQRLAGEALNSPHQRDWFDARDLAVLMVQGYIQWVQEEGHDVNQKVVAVEQPWRVKLATIDGVDVTIHGTIDLVLHNQMTGELTVIDHKSVQNLGQQPEFIDDQLLTYAWATSALLRHLGPVTGVGHNMLRRVKRTGRAKPPFYDRWIQPVNNTHLAKHQEHLVHQAVDLLSLKRVGSVESPLLYPNPTKDCSWRCDYRLVCALVDDGSDWEDTLDASFVEAKGMEQHSDDEE